MKLRSAYTVLLLQFPALATAIVAAPFGFLGAALPAVRLHAVGGGVESLDGGIAWGAAAAGISAIAFGIAALVLLRRGGAGRSARRRAATGIAACGGTGWASAVGFAALGSLAGSGREGGAILERVAETWSIGWPAAAAAAAMGLAIALTAWGKAEEGIRSDNLPP